MLWRTRLLPSVSLEEASDALPLARALLRAGVPVLEVSLDSPEAFSAIETIRSALPEFFIGAGGILSTAQLRSAAKAGSLFGSGPTLSRALLDAALSADFPFLPSAATPAEAGQGLDAGFTLQRFYPAREAGGPEMARALIRPFAQTRLELVAAGGVGAANFQDYLLVPGVLAVSGRFLCEPSLIHARQWEDLEVQARLCVQKAATLRKRPAHLLSPSNAPSHATSFYR